MKVRTRLDHAHLEIATQDDLLSTWYQVRVLFERTGRRFVHKYKFTQRASAERFAIRIRKRNSIDWTHWSKT